MKFIHSNHIKNKIGNDEIISAIEDLKFNFEIINYKNVLHDLLMCQAQWNAILRYEMNNSVSFHEIVNNKNKIRSSVISINYKFEEIFEDLNLLNKRLDILGSKIISIDRKRKRLKEKLRKTVKKR